MKLLLKVFNMLVFPLTLIVGLLLTLSGLAPNFSGQQSSVMPLLGLAFPLLFLLNALLLLYWGLQLKWRSLFPLAFGFLHLGQASLYLQWNSEAKAANGPSIRVATYNTQLLGHYSGEGSEDSLKALMREHEADVYCFQELYDKNRNLEALVKRLAQSRGFKHYAHYQLVAGRPYGMGIVSKYPIVKSKALPLEDASGNMAMWADIDFPQYLGEGELSDTRVRVYNLHLQSFRLHKGDYELIRDRFDGDSLEIEQSKGLVHRLSAAYQLRVGQSDKVRESLDNCPYPKWVLGDFNDVPVSYTYRVLSMGLRDAFVEAGQGLETTYKGPFPSFRIDYALYSSPFRCTEYQSFSEVPGDHRWVQARLIMPSSFAD